MHILLGYNPVQPLPDLVRDIKSMSSRFINESHLSPFRFEWQKGYACFSYSHTHIPQVSEYIANQNEHHKGLSLRDEIIHILNKYGIEYDDRYLLANPE